ncbi:hypothetical protein OMP38_33290 [Cohnella ginsengisoli]|uniref:LuxR family transcriptional regulator n=1 Tax=Cohnella ginsengisoli TaxID=425004 RepID=A0A9X4KPG7_9BACL|nr:hypothetical protein [Cohnella ginsengisoli]MDG0795159.1 hypothetical protein [Cohnella ginsengisoli]
MFKRNYTSPHVRNALVPRPRLTHKLDEGLRAKLTLISAPAGYGKTTALSEWARQCGILVAWLSLDIQDDEWFSFWSSVTAAIQKRVPGYARKIWPLLEKGPSASSVSSEPAISAMLNELNLLPEALAIVLDDYHAIEHPAIQKSLGYMLEHLPPHIHLYIASRNDLAFPTARLMTKGEMQRISVRDMRFRPEEGLVFFRNTAGLSLSREQVAELYDQTEGWVSGLQLAALTLKSSDNIAESIRQFNGHQHHISDYLLEEVFSRLSEEMRAFFAPDVYSKPYGSLPMSSRYGTIEQPGVPGEVRAVEFVCVPAGRSKKMVSLSPFTVQFFAAAVCPNGS